MLVYVQAKSDEDSSICSVAINPFSVSSIQEEPDGNSIIVLNNGSYYFTNESILDLVGKFNAEYQYK